MQEHEFRPDWASSPGETIAALLSERHLEVTDFASLISRDVHFVAQLLRGNAELSQGVAESLSKALGGSATFWIRREAQYRRALNSMRESEEELPRDQFAALMPVREMRKLGWIANQIDPVSACLEFFDVPSISAWQTQYYRHLIHTAFRTSPTFTSEPGAVAAWLRFGEREASSMACAPWNSESFRIAIAAARQLTRQKRPDDFVGALQRLYAQCGVAVIVAKAPAGCRASGAARFLSSRRALMMLSFRHLSDDHFWFTVFHESAHILLHGDRGVFVDGATGFADTSTEEQEANDFAAEILVPKNERDRMTRLRPLARDVIRFARDIGVSPGIVVGQLQHTNRLRPNQLNSLKRRYRWSLKRT